MIEIKGKNKKDSLILIKNKEISTVDLVFRQIMAINSEGKPLKDDDRFQMPVISLDIKKNYTEM